MPASLEQLQARLDALYELQATGIKSSSSGDKRAEFRDMADLNAAIAGLKAQIGTLQSTPARRSYRIIACKDL
ncbi:phage head-tail joining protein [Bradyrhizobium sp.]|uniref:phage head-tail joining protein n=1 Tax=Bradyrhizobium sp. TaxID=376 RepID=UPI0039E53AC1